MPNVSSGNFRENLMSDFYAITFIFTAISVFDYLGTLVPKNDATVKISDPWTNTYGSSVSVRRV